MGKAGVCCCTEQIPGLGRLQEKRTKMQMKWKKFETADKRPIADRLFCIKSLSTLIFFLDHLFLVFFLFYLLPIGLVFSRVPNTSFGDNHISSVIS